MRIAAELRVLFSLARGLPRGGSHADSLAQFYGPQAEHYDAFRERLLKGRRELVERLPVAAGHRVVELGGGTGRNLTYFGTKLGSFASVEVVDLCTPLLDMARARFVASLNVSFVQADATTYRPQQPVDCVFFSYALTMIPDWRRALDNAIAMLKSGGILGAVDFYVSGARPERGLARHGALARRFFPLWFAHDGVRLSPAHLPYLRSRLETLDLVEARGALPYLPWIKAPYYLFIGRKPSNC